MRLWPTIGIDGGVRKEVGGRRNETFIELGYYYIFIEHNVTQRGLPVIQSCYVRRFYNHDLLVSGSSWVPEGKCPKTPLFKHKQ